jgi:hypothetical protein
MAENDKNMSTLEQQWQAMLPTVCGANLFV